MSDTHGSDINNNSCISYNNDDLNDDEIHVSSVGGAHDHGSGADAIVQAADVPSPAISPPHIVTEKDYATDQCDGNDIGKTDIDTNTNSDDEAVAEGVAAPAAATVAKAGGRRDSEESATIMTTRTLHLTLACRDLIQMDW